MASHLQPSGLEPAIRLFLARLPETCAVSGVLLFGSQARNQARADSDADLAILLHGQPEHAGQRIELALYMADLAFDILLETGVLIEALPLWESEWEHPETFNNPALLHTIRREGIRL